MNNEKVTHISYQTAKALKEFCPELPEPMANERWATHRRLPYKEIEKGCHTDDDFNFSFAPAYQLHDLLSRPFCEALAGKTIGVRIGLRSGKIKNYLDVAHVVFQCYTNMGGIPAVEACLMEMIGGK